MPDSSSTSDLVLRWVVALLASGVVFMLQFHFFQSRPTKNNPNSPASFLNLSDIMSGKRLRNLARLYAVPFAALFFLLATRSEAFVTAAKNSLNVYLSGLSGEHLGRHVLRLLEAVPDYFTPLFVLCAALLLFAPYIRAPMTAFRDLVFFALAVDARCDQAAKSAARAVLSRLRYNDAKDKLEAIFSSSAPLPEELARSGSDAKLAYQLLYFSETETRIAGVESSLRNTLNKLGVSQPDAIAIAHVSLTPAHLAAATTFYCMLCLVYVFFAPMAAPWFKASALVHAFLPTFEWPLPEFRGELALRVAQYTLAFVAPLAVGMYLYALRRLQYSGKEVAFQSYLVALSTQFVAAFFVNFMFSTLMIAQRAAGDLEGVHLSLFEVKIWMDVFMQSLAPGAALFAWIQCGGARPRLSSYVIVCVAAALSFLACQYGYEFVSRDWRGLYWHHMFLGAFLTAAYCCAAIAAKDVLLPPPEPVTASDRARLQPAA